MFSPYLMRVSQAYSKGSKAELSKSLAGPEPPGKRHTSGIPMCFAAQPLSLYMEVVKLYGFVLVVAEL